MPKSPTIMVLCATIWQIPLVLKIKSMGFNVLCINPDKDSPAFKFADFLECIDVRNYDRCVQLAIDFEVVGVCSDQSDIAVTPVAFVAENTQLRGLSYKSANECTNKFLMREHCEMHGFPSIDYLHCNNEKKMLEFFKKHSGKIVVKPLNSNSSRGVSIVDSEDCLIAAYMEAIGYSYGDHSVLLEEYIDGVEFTVDGIVINGKHFSLGVSRKKHYVHNPSIAYELFFSFKDSHYDYDELRKVNDIIYESLNLPDGTLTHAEYKSRNNEFILIEYAARGGGNLISSDIIPFLSGFDNYKYYINSRIGRENKNFTYDINKYQNRCAVLRFFDFDIEGEVIEIRGEDYLDSLSEVSKYEFNISLGDRLDKPKNDASRLGYYIAFSENEGALRQIMEDIEQNVDVRVQ